MTGILRVLLMARYQPVIIVVNFLYNAYRDFVCIHYFNIARVPRNPALPDPEIAPPATGQLFPLRKTPFVLLPVSQ